jgi:hypothetical protein
MSHAPALPFEKSPDVDCPHPAIEFAELESALAEQVRDSGRQIRNCWNLPDRNLKLLAKQKTFHLLKNPVSAGFSS